MHFSEKLVKLVAKLHQIRFPLAFRLIHRWGAYSALQTERPLAVLEGLLSLLLREDMREIRDGGDGMKGLRLYSAQSLRQFLNSNLIGTVEQTSTSEQQCRMTVNMKVEDFHFSQKIKLKLNYHHYTYSLVDFADHPVPAAAVQSRAILLISNQFDDVTEASLVSYAIQQVHYVAFEYATVNFTDFHQVWRLLLHGNVI